MTQRLPKLRTCASVDTVASGRVERMYEVHICEVGQMNRSGLRTLYGKRDAGGRQSMLVVVVVVVVVV